MTFGVWTLSLLGSTSMKSTFGDLSNSSKNKGLNLLDFKTTGLEPKKLMNCLDLSGFITDFDLQFEVHIFSEGHKNQCVP